ncbi:sigma-70 family RNA polymerase sigma factor [Actinoplanes sp. NPDC051851]|uniref:sigma-70 family RNA polymerase sigma factor n=1 Tax=Actinoplanes sp. NPDC051851 TaxID=3154753 RepID=UPI00341E1B2E
MTESQTAFDGQTAMARDTTILVREAQSGDVGALEQLITGHLPLVYNVIGRALDGHPDVDDLVQETMLRAIRGLSGLRQPDRFRSWLIAIAYRQIQMHLRSRKMTLLRHHPEPVDVADPAGDFAERTTAEMVVTEQRREIAEAHRWLEEGDRELLALWWQEASGRLTRAELAAALEVKPKHAAVRVQRMKAQLDLARGVVRALRARPICPELADMIRFWDGTTDSVWRKRLARHVRDCPRCRVRQGGLVAPEQLLLGVAAIPVPFAVAAAVQAAVHGGAAVPATTGGLSLAASVQSLVQQKALAAATVATVAVGGGFAYAVLETPSYPEPGVTAVGPAAGPITTRPPVSLRPTTATATSAAPASPSASRTTAAGTGVSSADIYVAPGGSDTADGSLAHPFASIAKAVATVRAGRTIALRGGTYHLSGPISITTSGTAAKRVVLSGYRGEHPVIDASAVASDQWAVTQRASYWSIQDLEVSGARNQAWVCSGCVGTVFQRITVHGGASAGLMLRDAGTVGNQVLESDFYDNQGSGLSVQFGSGEGNVLRGNRAYRNAGDGIDLGSFGSPVDVEHNWSYRNGANGFSLGGGSPAVAAAHTVRNNAAWNNGSHGFVDEGNGAVLTLGNNTAFRNTGLGFAITTSPATLRYNVAVGNTQGEVGLAASGAATHNSWQEGSWSAARFRSADPSGAESARTATGALPATAYLVVTSGGYGASMAGE